MLVVGDTLQMTTAPGPTIDPGPTVDQYCGQIVYNSKTFRYSDYQKLADLAFVINSEPFCNGSFCPVRGAFDAWPQLVVEPTTEAKRVVRVLP